MTEQTMQFQAEVARLLHIVTHSLYSDKKIFLRELVSNASDACDRLRYEALTRPELLEGAADLHVTIAPDKAAGTITLTDNGIGMSRDELVANLGTIARSGTGAFVSGLTGDAAKDVSLIGQFGVGFYSSFIVAEKVEVVSRRAGTTETWRWISDGTGSFQIGEAEEAPRGTRITLHLRKDAAEFLEPVRLRDVIKTYSDHIALPVRLVADGKDEVANAASAIWTRPKSEIGEEQYKEFYHHVSHGFDDPWATIHAHAEGKLDYHLLLFIPTRRPIDLFDPARKASLKLYVRRVFITDNCEGLLPSWLRFVKGIVDSADLPLNVSRELLQDNPILARIRANITKRVLSELEKRARDDAAGFAEFWDSFGAVLKEGIYEDAEHREQLLKLARFHSSAGEGLVTLEEYTGRMKEGQAAIYTIAGDDLANLRRSPQLEGYKAKNIEVLLLTDSVDDFWLSVAHDFGGKPFRSVTRGNADLDAIKSDAPKADEKPKAEGAALGTLIAALKQALGERVKDVRESNRLTDSAVCLVAGEGDLDMHLERMLRQHKRIDTAATRVLEINAAHPLVLKMAERATGPGATDALNDLAELLYDQARIAEGDLPSDPAGFARRMAAMMARSL